jgi:hypothetical protein
VEMLTILIIARDSHFLVTNHTIIRIISATLEITTSQADVWVSAQIRKTTSKIQPQQALLPLTISTRCTLIWWKMSRKIHMMMNINNWRFILARWLFSNHSQCRWCRFHRGRDSNQELEVQYIIKHAALFLKYNLIITGYHLIIKTLLKMMMIPMYRLPIRISRNNWEK